MYPNIIDQVIDTLRQTRIKRCDQLAKRLKVNSRELSAAWHLLTGTHLSDAILEWRIHQALDLLTQAGHPWTDKPGICPIPTSVLQEVAVQCGWRNATVLKHALRRADRLSKQ